MSTTAEIQAYVRANTATAYSYEGDLHALCDLAGVPAGHLLERLGALLETLPQGVLALLQNGSVEELLPILAPFSPASLFAAGEQGVWYDPSDFSTMFQDAAGTMPVTAMEQPVGLILDKSKGLVLGPELVANGDFSSGTGWSVETNWTISGGFATHTSGGDGYIIQSLAGKVTAGKTYKITSVFTGTAPILAGGNLTASNVTLVSGDIYVIANGTSLAIYSNANCSIDNISVRELPGNHAYQSTTTSRPTLSARYNLLKNTEQFDDAAVWDLDNGAAVNPVVTANYGVAPNGTQTADRIVLNKTGGVFSRIQQSAATTLGTSYIFSVWLKTTSAPAANVGIRIGGTGLNCAVTSTWQQFSVSTTATGASLAGQILLFDSISGNDETADILAWGADLRVANDGIGLPAYQRVDTATDYDYAGFPPYLKFDGTDDSMATGSIDFTATDKMTVCAGVRKLSDSQRGVLLELSATYANNGTFAIEWHSVTLQDYQFVSTGSIIRAAASPGYPAPITNVLTGIGNISGDQAILRVNGTQAASNTADQGTGNYGNYPLYIGHRGGTSLPFNGRLYGLIVRGAATDATQLEQTEQWINSKMGGIY